MSRVTKYSIEDFKQDFPTDLSCLDFIFDLRHTRECQCSGYYSLIRGRKKYQCSKCRLQISPTAGTLLHKSDTPLQSWFHAIWVFSNAKSGISAKELERQLGVTYKCAYRILSQIRKALKQEGSKLSGDVEMDHAYFGGRGRAGRDNERLGEVMRRKSVVMGAVERNGRIRALVVPDATAETHRRFVEENIAVENTRLLTDRTNRLDVVARNYDRHAVDHHRGEYVRDDIHINNIETFWSHLKRSIKGTHKVISKEHLQEYLDGFVFHYNNRNNDFLRFASLLSGVLYP